MTGGDFAKRSEVVGVVSEAGLESGGGVNPGAPLIKPVQSLPTRPPHPDHLRGSGSPKTANIELRNQKPRRTAVKVTTIAVSVHLSTLLSFSRAIPS